MIYYNDDCHTAGKYDSGIMTPAIKTDSGLTSIVPVSRMRPSSFNQPIINMNQHRLMFLNEDISSQMYQQQWEIDQFIAHHTENVRREMEEMRKRNAKRLMEAAEEGIMKKRLKTKEEEIRKMGELNNSLQERVKSLSVENQIWMELAQTNEATANTLRNNLQIVLNHQTNATNIIIDDTESCCGSSNNYENNQQTANKHATNEYLRSGSNGLTLCRKCGKNESSILLLPCRHLCVCNVCDAAISICPVCKSTKSAGVHVNMT